MCTLSWQLEPNGYQVYFNRDEQRSRAIAQPVTFHTELCAAYPVDPQGGGTWIALTQAGGCLCLLNNYQAQAVYQPRDAISRGEIILRLLAQINQQAQHSDKIDDLASLIAQLPLARFSPFVLCYFPADLNQQQGQVQHLVWDGKQLSNLPARNPLTSSGLDFPAVSTARYQYFDEIKPQSTQVHLDYHASHQPERSAFSVCMHRADAHTVSFSHIKVVSGKTVVFDYYQGSPCQSIANPAAKTQINLTSQ
ncbi:hypothetical protein DXX93_02205 [Thalassotalea euphylliae]|uniref:NRDE family protein n=1 Tax=Thalassotalea euphylliae TaxID=1655234 RepID=A0A3E0TM96_9GAMM|nr:NRDE family protein [Thalassotalea euphylliae]REL25477.1 hypothetical protein DXX93_02205 [Thalassotalea euphylliae]